VEETGMKNKPCFKINNLDTSGQVIVVAELSANHNQDIEEAIRLIHEAKDVGADAVKIQTYTPDTITIDCNSELFRIRGGTIWDGRTLYDLYKEAYTPWEWHPILKETADNLGIALFSTPFDLTAVDFLETQGVPVYKIASLELVDIPLLRYVASKHKPVILSTGASTLAEIDEAVKTLRENGAKEIALLKCTSAYPAPPDEINLSTIPHMAAMYNTVVGLSDHTLGTAVPAAAVALGARIIEKHFTLSRSTPGPDSKFSLEPDEFRVMIKAIREAEKAVGEISYEISEHEKAGAAFKRSLFVVMDIKKGEPFSRDNVRSIRPGNGMHTRYFFEVIERIAAKDIKAGTPLKWDLIA
jgi:pseudaminic acid synthase